VPSEYGNQASLRTLTRPGDVVLASENAHLLRYEAGAPAALWGVHVKTIGRDGLFDARDVQQAAVPARDSHVAPTTVLAFENTHNFAGGRIFPQGALRDAAAAARELGLSLHLDGARLFNAVIVTGIPPRWAEPSDTVSSPVEGSAPVGRSCAARARRSARCTARAAAWRGDAPAGIPRPRVCMRSTTTSRARVDHANAGRRRGGPA
jgi:threonine aldolase